jgi:aspartyl protease family protein
MRSLLITCILIGLAAVAAPQLFTHYVRQPTTANMVSTPETPAAEEGTAPPPGVRQVEIEAERDGHFYVSADINSGHDIRLMVDTGATVVALRASDAAAAGIRPVTSEYTNPVQTANGTTMAAEATLDSISVEDIEIHHVRALVLPDDQLSLSLLGGSFLKGLQRYQVADGTLVFEN